jgi:outer membrane protein OmpA-like peptidoglycan-associated protein
MYQRTAAAVAFASVLGIGTAFSQTPPQAPNPTQRGVDTAPEVNPVFRVTVIGRSTTAINYRPRSGETKIDFAGTPLLPGARGDATIKGERGYIRVDANFENLEPATKFGPEYLTYVLWAITPEGRATNLGELQVSGDDGELDVTTELQAFGLIVTAEPYFAVTQPSDVVVIENRFRKEGVFKDATVGSTDVIEARYQLLKRGTYLMNQPPANYQPQEIKPGVPLDLAEARNAINLARLAGADQYAADTFGKARELLAQAEKARGRNNIMMPARQAVQTAEDARLISLQRQEEELNARLRAQADAERQAAEQRQTEALARARAEEDRRRQAELDARNAAAARAAADREREVAEAARLAADRDRADAEAQRASADALRRQAEAQAQQAAEQAAQARAAAEQAERDKEALRDKLREQLNIILETRETARGLIVNVSDVLFDFNSANLKPGAREKLARVAGILQAYPGLQIAIEGHTDSVGSDEYNQRLSERRAVSVRTYLTQNGTPESTVTALGFGEAQPVATNASSAGRQQNRRVELVVSGEPIGTSETTGTVGTSGRQ